MLAVLTTHISEPPVLSSTPLPLLPPKVVMGKPQTPHPCYCYHNSGPLPVIVGKRVCCIIVNEQYRYNSPVQIYHLRQEKGKKNKSNKEIEEEKKKIKDRNNAYTQWLDWMWLMNQKRTLTLKKKRILTNRRGWSTHHAHKGERPVPSVMLAWWWFRRERYKKIEGSGTRKAITALFKLLPMASIVTLSSSSTGICLTSEYVHWPYISSCYRNVLRAFQFLSARVVYRDYCC